MDQAHAAWLTAYAYPTPVLTTSTTRGMKTYSGFHMLALVLKRYQPTMTHYLAHHS